MRLIFFLLVPILVAGCADLRLPWGDRAPRAAAVEPPVQVAPPPERPEDVEELALAAPGAATGQSAAALDRASPTQRAAAQAGAGREGSFLGETLASLGAPGEAGFWLVTGLVDAPVQGRVETVGGQSVGVELRPSGREPGSGSQISLSAMRSLDLPLTALPTLRVFRGS